MDGLTIANKDCRDLKTCSLVDLVNELHRRMNG
jgi:hypothetical protein